MLRFRCGSLCSRWRGTPVQPSMSGFVMHSHSCGLGSVDRIRQHSFAPALQQHRLVAHRRSLATRASVVAQPASVDVKTFDGSSSGSQDLSLKVAGRDTAKGLVHRYLVTVRQNARAVGIQAEKCIVSAHVAVTACWTFSCREQLARKQGLKSGEVAGNPSPRRVLAMPDKDPEHPHSSQEEELCSDLRSSSICPSHDRCSITCWAAMFVHRKHAALPSPPLHHEGLLVVRVAASQPQVACLLCISACYPASEPRMMHTFCHVAAKKLHVHCACYPASEISVTYAYCNAAAKGLGNPNEQEGAQISSGNSAAICNSQHNHSRGPQGETESDSATSQACKVVAEMLLSCS